MNKTPPPARIDAPRVYLRKHALEDVPVIFGAVDRDRARLGKFLPWVEHVRGLEDEREYVAMTIEQWEQGGLFDYGLYRREGDCYLGNVGVHTISWEHERCELGYWVLSEGEGRGFVSEAVGALTEALFSIGFNRLEIRCSSANARSAAVPRRLAFRHEGTLREDLVEQGRFRDTLVFARLRREFRKDAPA